MTSMRMAMLRTAPYACFFHYDCRVNGKRRDYRSATVRLGSLPMKNWRIRRVLWSAESAEPTPKGKARVASGPSACGALSARRRCRLSPRDEPPIALAKPSRAPVSIPVRRALRPDVCCCCIRYRFSIPSAGHGNGAIFVPSVPSHPKTGSSRDTSKTILACPGR